MCSTAFVENTSFLKQNGALKNIQRNTEVTIDEKSMVEWIQTAFLKEMMPSRCSAFHFTSEVHQVCERSIPLAVSVLWSASLASLFSADGGPWCPDHSRRRAEEIELAGIHGRLSQKQSYAEKKKVFKPLILSKHSRLPERYEQIWPFLWFYLICVCVFILHLGDLKFFGCNTLCRSRKNF